MIWGEGVWGYERDISASGQFKNRYSYFHCLCKRLMSDSLWKIIGHEVQQRASRQVRSALIVIIKLSVELISALIIRLPKMAIGSINKMTFVRVFKKNF